MAVLRLALAAAHLHPRLSPGSHHRSPHFPLKTLNHLILDWSGTLVDDLPAVWQASNHCFEQAGVPTMSLPQFRAEFTLPYEPFYQQRAPHVALTQLERWFQDRMRGLRDGVTELPHAREFLVWARQSGLTLHLLSAIHPDDFAAQVRQNGFDQYFHSIHLRALDKVTVIGRLLAEHRLDPASTLYVGDMEHDIHTARHGGVRSAGVLTGYNSRAQLEAARPDWIFEHLGELRAHLEASAVSLNVSPATPRRFPIPTVGALIFDDAGRVLMIQTHKWSHLWGIPGGKIEWGEASEAALHREILEETALKITEARMVLVQDAIHPSEFHRDAHFLLLNYVCRAPGHQTVQLNDEAEEFRWVTVAEATRMSLNTPTRILLEHWALHGAKAGLLA